MTTGPSTTDPGSGAGSLGRLAVGDGCWNRIGVSGDRSCPELPSFVHCRNCPVFAAAARAFFDRPAPEGYLAEWARWLADSDGLGPRGDEGEAMATPRTATSSPSVRGSAS